MFYVFYYFFPKKNPFLFQFSNACVFLVEGLISLRRRLVRVHSDFSLNWLSFWHSWLLYWLLILSICYVPDHDIISSNLDISIITLTIMTTGWYLVDLKQMQEAVKYFGNSNQISNILVTPHQTSNILVTPNSNIKYQIFW